MFRKFCFRKQAAGGFRRRGPTRRAFARCVRCRCTGFFSVVQHASASRHGGSPAAGLAASRHPRRDRQQLHRCSGGLRLPAAPCSAGVPLQAQMLAAWRRPPRGALVGPRCQGRIRSGRPFKAPNGHGGRSRARRPSGEPGLRGVARVDLCIAREIVCHMYTVNRALCRCELAQVRAPIAPSASLVGCASRGASRRGGRSARSCRWCVDLYIHSAHL